MLQVMLGKTGTGKTTALLERAITAAREGTSTILLVPEQFSFEMERTVAARLHAPAALNLSVLSFSRLSENIFRTYGGLTGRRLNDVARVVLMRLAVGEMKDTLQVYHTQVGKPAFFSLMLDTVEELKQAGATPQSLAAVAQGITNRQLSLKLQDIVGIYGAYQALVERSFTDPLDEISRATHMAVEHRFFAGKQVFVDGFNFFSPPEREMLYAMLEQAEKVTVSFTMDSMTSRGDVDIFGDQKTTAHRLENYARQHNVKIAAPLRFEENLRTHLPALMLVEEQLSQTGPLANGLSKYLPDQSDTGPLPEESGVDPTGVLLVEAATPYEEIRYVAAEIARLVRDEDMRYRDMAIVCRRLDDYRTMLRATLENSGIPVFMDRKESVLEKPMASFLVAALEAASKGLRVESVLKVARSPAMGLSPEQAAALENYVYVWSIQGAAWQRPFLNNPAGLGDMPPDSYAQEVAGIKEARQRVIGPLVRLAEELEGCDGKGFSVALYDYVCETEALDNLSEYFAADPEKLEENDRIWNSVVDIFDLFSETLAGAGQSPRELTALFELALAGTRLGDIPGTGDQVIAGAADTVRLGSPRVVFVVGVNEGVFPARIGSHGVFTDQERDILIASDLEIASPAFQRAVQERFYLYSALSSPREKLVVSYAVTTSTGAPAKASLAVETLKKFLPGAFLSLGSCSPYEFIYDTASLQAGYAALAGTGGSQEATLRHLLEHRGETRFLESVDQALLGAPMGDILPGTARKLLGDRLTLSPSRIETYYQCPYNFFCNYMLRLRPRRRVAYTPLESGNAIHYVLEMLLKDTTDRGISALTDQELEDAISGYLTDYITAMAADEASLAARFRYQFRRLSVLLFSVIRHIGEEFDQSRFTAAGMEVTVGTHGEVRPPAIVLDDGMRIELVGKIDRVDTFEDETGKYVRVVDYKSGGKDFRLSDVAYGLNMQMLIYLFAICDDTRRTFGNVSPAGVLYMPGRLEAAELADETDHDEVKRQLDKMLQMKGLVLEDEEILRAMERELEGNYIPVRLRKDQSFDARSPVLSSSGFTRLRQQVYDQIGVMAQSISCGKISPNPVKGAGHDPCGYCDFAQLCNNREGTVHREVIPEERGAL